MEFTELADYPLPAGTLTEWLPTAGVEAWSRDDRPLSHLHEDHCERASRAAGHSRSSWLGTIFEVPMRYDEARLGETLRIWMARHDAFRTTARMSDCPDETGYVRYSCAASDVDVQPHSVGRLRTGTRVYQHLSDFFETRLSATRWPHCLVATVSDVDAARPESFLLVFGADHSVMDAYSMMLAISELQRIYRACGTGNLAELPEVGSYIEYGGLDRQLGDELTAEHPVVRTWQSYLDRCEKAFPAFPLDVAALRPRESAARCQSGLSAWVLTADQALALQARSRAAGCNVQAAVFATLAATHRDLIGDGPLRFAMPMHTRYEPSAVHAMGWYVGLVPIEIDATYADCFDELLGRASSAVASMKSVARYPYPRIAKLLANESVPRFVVSYLDIRYVPDAVEWQNWNVRPLRSGEQSDDDVYFWIARSPAGIAISARFPSNEVASANVHRFINTFTSRLTAVSEGADLRVPAMVGSGGERR